MTHPAAESVIARIVALVEQASVTKARTQLFIEKDAAWHRAADPARPRK